MRAFQSINIPGIINVCFWPEGDPQELVNAPLYRDFE